MNMSTNILTHTAMHVAADMTMRAQAIIPMSMKNMSTPMRTAMHAAADTIMPMRSMRMNILTSTHTVTHVAADTTIPMSMKNMNMLTRTVTHVAADIPMSMKNMNMLTHTAMHVVAAMIMMDIPMSMHMLIHTLTTFLVIPLLASAKFAIRMKNTATFAAKA